MLGPADKNSRRRFLASRAWPGPGPVASTLAFPTCSFLSAGGTCGHGHAPLLPRASLTAWMDQGWK